MTYEYVCLACRHEWEFEQPISAKPLETCPSCAQKTAKRQVSGGAGFILKGGGWYADGYTAKKPSGGSDDKKSSEKAAKPSKETAPSAKESTVPASPKPARTRDAVNHHVVSGWLGLTTALVTTATLGQEQARAPRRIDLATPEPPASEESSKPREFALGLALLKEHGFGVVGRLRWNHVALDAAYGVMPLLILWQTADGSTMHVDADVSFVHVDAGPVFFFNDHLDRFQNGLRLAADYNLVLGPGAGLGWVGGITKRSFAIALGAGLQYYPDAGDRVRRRFHYAPGSDVSAAALQVYFGLNLLWYLG